MVGTIVATAGCGRFSIRFSEVGHEVRTAALPGGAAKHVGNVLFGTLLGVKCSFNLDGAFIGEIIGGGKSITLLSGAKVSGRGSIPNTATVSADKDPNPGNNSSSATIRFQ